MIKNFFGTGQAGSKPSNPVTEQPITKKEKYFGIGCGSSHHDYPKDIWEHIQAQNAADLAAMTNKK